MAQKPASQGDLAKVLQNIKTTSGLAAVVVTKNNESPTGKGKAYELGLPISNHKGMENAPMANVTAKVDKNTQRANRLDKIIPSIEKMRGMGPHEFLH